MNHKATRKALNVAFKRFQRLPDWPFDRSVERTSGLIKGQQLDTAKQPERHPPPQNILPLTPGFLGTGPIEPRAFN